jgi:hypothetical protein
MLFSGFGRENKKCTCDLDSARTHIPGRGVANSIGPPYFADGKAKEAANHPFAKSLQGSGVDRCGLLPKNVRS